MSEPNPERLEPVSGEMAMAVNRVGESLEILFGDIGALESLCRDAGVRADALLTDGLIAGCRVPEGCSVEGGPMAMALARQLMVAATIIHAYGANGADLVDRVGGGWWERSEAALMLESACIDWSEADG